MNINLLCIIISTIVLGGSGIFGFIYDFKRSKKIFFGNSDSLKERFKSSFIFGISGGLILTSFFLFGSIVESTYDEWTLKGFLGVFIFAFASGLLIAIGSLWRYFIVGKYRNYLKRK